MFTARRMFDDYDDVYRRILAPESSGAVAGLRAPASPPAAGVARAMAHAVS